MGMIGEYARLSPADLSHALQDPHWAHEFITESIETELDAEPNTSQPRYMDIDKAWDTLRFLLRRINFPIDIVHGEEDIPGADDWGHTPPRYLTPQHVRTAAATLATTPSDVLIKGVTAAELTQADLYPNTTEDHEQWLTYVTDHYQALIPFFQAAAHSGDAIVVWLG